MSILMRFGLHYNLRIVFGDYHKHIILLRIIVRYQKSFLIGESSAGMYKNDRPFSTGKDCWIGKHNPDIKFDIPEMINRK